MAVLVIVVRLKKISRASLMYKPLSEARFLKSMTFL